MNAAPVCRACASFRGTPAEIEAALPGLSSMGSAYAAVRGDDGLCAVHERFVSARASCAAFRATKSNMASQPQSGFFDL